MITRRTVISFGNSLQITITYGKDEEDEVHRPENDAERQETIRMQIKPFINSKMVKMLSNTWGPIRPSEFTLKNVKVNFLPMADTNIWWSEKGLKIPKSCDVHKEHFIEELAHCSHQVELENICRKFDKEIKHWIAKLADYPLTIKNYSKEVQEATMQEIKERANSIRIGRPLAVLAKMPTAHNVHRIRIMLRQLWCIRFVHKDKKRPWKRKLKSICVKPNKLHSKNRKN